MHNDDIERPGPRDDDTRSAVDAADDTGMVSQQIEIADAELVEGDSGVADGIDR